MRSNRVYAGIYSALLLLVSLGHVAADKTVWDYAPDFSKDPFPPYPDLKNSDGSSITVQNLRGVHLYGWKGCQKKESDGIKEAYNDFYKMAQLPELYANIDWNDKAAREFWGPSTGKTKIPDGTRNEIQQIYAAAQQVYNYPWTWQPPWLSWRQLWIEVRCSDSKLGKDSSDPDNKCGDGKPNDGNCPGGTPPVGGTNQLEAFSDPAERYSRITFCSGFFNLNSLSDVVKSTKAKSQAQQNDLRNWNNRARVFFHEVTHLDYFMNAGDDPKDKSPYVSDLKIRYRWEGALQDFEAYGPFNAKIIRNYVTKRAADSAYYSQRNADNYAYFALAKYVQKIIGRYPDQPSPGTIRPVKAPSDSNGQPVAANAPSDPTGDDSDPIGTAEATATPTIQGYSIPGCGGKFGQLDAASAAASISSAHTASPSPTFSCHHGADPHSCQGTGYCDCSDGKLYPETLSCAYTAPPASTFSCTPHTTLKPQPSPRPTGTDRVHVRRWAELDSNPNKAPHMRYEATVFDSSDAKKGDSTGTSPYSQNDAVKVSGLFKQLQVWGEGYGFDKPVHIAYGSLNFSADKPPNGVKCNVGGEDGVHFTQDLDCWVPDSGSA